MKILAFLLILPALAFSQAHKTQQMQDADRLMILNAPVKAKMEELDRQRKSVLDGSNVANAKVSLKSLKAAPRGKQKPFEPRLDCAVGMAWERGIIQSLQDQVDCYKQ